MKKQNVLQDYGAGAIVFVPDDAFFVDREGTHSRVLLSWNGA